MCPEGNDFVDSNIFLNLVPGIQDLYFLNYRISRFIRSIFVLIFSRCSSENHFIVFNSH